MSREGVRQSRWPAAGTKVAWAPFSSSLPGYNWGVLPEATPPITGQGSADDRRLEKPPSGGPRGSSKAYTEEHGSSGIKEAMRQGVSQYDVQ